jgi:hypothetical protein
MKKLILLLFLVPFLNGCDENNLGGYRNPNIPNYPVSLQINLNLPAFSNLQFPVQHIIDLSQGARGIVVFNTGSGYTAFDLADPNIAFQTCNQRMNINGINAISTCQNPEVSYSLFTGLANGQVYSMKPYRVQVSGNTLVITN